MGADLLGVPARREERGPAARAEVLATTCQPSRSIRRWCRERYVDSCGSRTRWGQSPGPAGPGRRPSTTGRSSGYVLPAGQPEHPSGGRSTRCGSWAGTSAPHDRHAAVTGSVRWPCVAPDGQHRVGRRLLQVAGHSRGRAAGRSRQVPALRVVVVVGVTGRGGEPLHRRRSDGGLERRLGARGGRCSGPRAGQDLRRDAVDDGPRGDGAEVRRLGARDLDDARGHHPLDQRQAHRSGAGAAPSRQPPSTRSTAAGPPSRGARSSRRGRRRRCRARADVRSPAPRGLGRAARGPARAGR